MRPEELHFAETHEWLAVTEQDGRKLGTVGISAFAVEQMTDLVFLSLPSVGKSFKAGQPFGEIESVKAVSDLYSPVSGEIAEVNQGLTDHLEVLSKDPYGQGWLIKLWIEDETEFKKLLDYPTYQAQCKAEG